MWLAGPYDAVVDDVRDAMADRKAIGAPRLAGLGLLAGLLTWTLLPLAPQGNLDGSWKAALVMSLERGLRFGPEIDFTFGPLGFLDLPHMYSEGLGAIGWLATSAIHLLLCVAIALAAGRCAGWVTAVGLTAIGAIASIYLEPFVALSCLLLLVLVRELGRPADNPPHERRELLVVGAVAATCAVASLVKLSDALAIIAIGLALAAASRARWPALATFGAVFVVAFVASWTIAGQRPGDIGDWLGASIQLVSGYSSAMGLPGPERLEGNRNLETAALLVTTVPVLVALTASLRGWTTTRRTAVLAAFGVFWFLGYKAGFVRHGAGPFFASLLVVVVFVLPWRIGLRRERLLALAVLGPAFVATQGIALADLDPVGRASNAVSQVTTILDEEARRATIEEARAEIRATYAVPPEMLVAIGGAGVHVAPFDAAVAWAHPELRWAPLPIFQTYAAYTADLDARDAAVLASPDGPEFVLRKANATIDGRLEWYEAPRTMLALACNFREVGVASPWQLLERAPDRCSAPRPLGSVSVRLGETVTVPDPGDADTIVVARIHGLQSDPLERLRTLLASASVWSITIGEPYRLVPGTADGPLIVGRPPGLLYATPNDAPGTDSFIVRGGESVLVPYVPQPEIELVIDFEAIEVGPWPEP